MLTLQDTQNLMQEIQALYKKYGKEDFALAERAYEYALQAHGERKRRSGEPYIVHPVGAARELLAIEPDLTTIVVTLLHDTVSHGKGTFEELEKIFGITVRSMVESLDRIGHMHYHGEEAKVDRMQRTMLSLASDIRALFVKFAERTDNLKILPFYADKNTAQEIAQESLTIYAPLAARLGLWSFKELIETRCLKFLEPEAYTHITGELAHYTLELDDFLTNAVTKIKSILPEKYQNSVTYRAKSVYSIFRKLRASGTASIRDLYDIFALRIIVDDIADCYHILGIIHSVFTPLSQRFKDFIAVPKPNGYQSLHTTVLGFYGFKQPIEIQIRTKEMNINAEKGTAAHILYKIYGDDAQANDRSKDLVQLAIDTLVDEEGVALTKKHDAPTLFVFSPKGDSFELPQGATPVDFAYAVHTNVGHKTQGARINGRIVTLDSLLHDGDVVEIMTHPSAHPVTQWLDFAVSTKARSQISVELKRLSGDRDRMIELGRNKLITGFAQVGIALAPDLANFWQYYGSRLDSKKEGEFLYQIAQGMRKPSSFFPRKKVQKAHTSHPKNAEISDIIIGGAKQIPHQKAGCCEPKFPEDIVAVLRTGGKCMIHRSDCPSLIRSNPNRRLPAYWRSGDRGRLVSLRLLFGDQEGLLTHLAQILYDMHITILEINANVLQEKNHCEFSLRLEIPDDNPSLIDRFLDRVQLEMPSFLSKDEEFFDNHK